MRRPRFAFALLAALLLAACQSLTVPMNEPLGIDAQGRPDFAANYGIGRYQAELREGELRSDAAQSDLLIFVAFSGGGKRSAAFAHGALRGLRAIPVRPPRGSGWTTLDDVDYISGVSGGSFPAAHYGLYRERSFDTFPREFLKIDINSYIYGIYLLPWHWDWIVNPLVGTNDYMAQIYDRLMFRGATYAELVRRGPPLISVNATDITNEVSFPFMNNTFGLLCSDLNKFPLARAVAASNGFPGLFSPITIESFAARCRGMRPPDSPPPQWAEPPSLTSRRAELARIANVYADPNETRWIHLVDGGVSDNLALRALLSVFITLEPSSPLFREQAMRTRRILLLSVDGESAPDRSLGRQRMVGGLMTIFNAASSTLIDAHNFETLALAVDQLKHLESRVRAVRCAQARVIDGHRCDDVASELVHVALSGIDDPTWRERLETIPTGLTIPEADVDALVEYGEQLISNHPKIRAIAATAGVSASGPVVASGPRVRSRAQ